MQTADPRADLSRWMPDFPAAPRVESTTVSGVEEWYYPVIVTANMIGRKAADPGTIRVILALYQILEEDEYIRTLKRYYQGGLERFGDDWEYADLVTAAYASAEMLRPKAYLEIGVRRGRSMAAVALAAPTCDVVGFDRWT